MSIIGPLRVKQQTRLPLCSYDQWEVGGLIRRGLDSNPGPNPGFTVRPLSTAGPSTAAGEMSPGEAAAGQASGKSTSQGRASRSLPGEASPAPSWAATLPTPTASGSSEVEGSQTKRLERAGAKDCRERLATVSRQHAGGGRGQSCASLRCDPVAGRGGVAAACGSERRAEAEVPLPEARCLEPGVSCPVPSFRHFPSLLLQDPRAGKRDTRRSSAAGRRVTGETGLAPPPFVGLGLGRSAGLGGPSVDAMSPTSFQ